MIQRPSDVDGSQQLYVPQPQLYAQQQPLYVHPRSRSNSGRVPVLIRRSVSSSPVIQRPSDVDRSQQLYVPQTQLYVHP